MLPLTHFVTVVTDFSQRNGTNEAMRNHNPLAICSTAVYNVIGSVGPHFTDTSLYAYYRHLFTTEFQPVVHKALIPE